MEDKILFVNKRPNFTDEFLIAMKDSDFVITTVKNGVEALKRLEEQEYKVVITGLIMDELDGNQLIAHINSDYPSTVCVVLTTKMNVGQLAYLVNQLEVYRIYLRPVDLEGQFLEMLKDAVIYYDHRLLYTQKQIIMQSNREQSEQKWKRMQLLMNGIDDTNRWVEEFVSGILEFSITKAKGYEDNFKAKLFSFEKRLVHQYLEVGNEKWNQLDEVQHEIQKMISTETEAQVQIDLPLGIRFSQNLCQNLFFVVWLLHLKISSIMKRYQIQIKGENLGSEKLMIRINVQLELEQWKRIDESIIGRGMNQIIACFFEGMTHDFLEEERENQVVYSFTLFRN